MLLDPKHFENEYRQVQQPIQTKLLNVGCGSHYHKDWVNLDLISDNLDVMCHDLTCGLPFPDEHFDAVYHSHVLEHLKPNDGLKLLEECLRVLKPGGIARVVVPDLERIAKLYLEMHDKAWEGDPKAKSDYDWMKLELLDQLVRENSGGRMGPFMTNPEIRNSDFVKSRVGYEFRICNDHDRKETKSATFLDLLVQKTSGIRNWLARKFIRILLGPPGESALDEGLFRNSGEVHRWMYDRFSLKDLCSSLGFVDFQILAAPISQIPAFEKYELDIIEGEIRKPDSLFIECRKPARM